MAEPGLTELAATTLRKRSGKIHDNITNNNPLLYKMNKAGNIVKNVTGRTLVEETDYDENGTFIRYSGDDVLDTTKATVLTAYEYNYKQAAVAVRMNGLEEVQNGGIHQSINLLTARVKNAERTIRNQIEGDLRSDGTASGGKQIGGLDLLVAEDETTGTVGGVNRATTGNEYARNYSYDVDSEGNGAATATAGANTNIEFYLREVITATHRMGDTNRLGLLGNTYWNLLGETSTNRQRYVDKDLANIGFENIKFEGVTMCLGGGYSSNASDVTAFPATKAWILNLDYIRLQVGKGRYFQPLKDREAINQDAMIKYLVFCGNLTCSNFGLQAVLFDA